MIDFNFGLDPGVGDPPQGLIFFTRSAAAAKKARAGIVRYAEKLAKAAIPRDFLRLERNVLLLWLIPAQRPSQARTIATCLTRSV